MARTIFLLGAYGQNNIGDDALLEAFLHNLSPARFIVNSAQPAETSARYGVEAIPTQVRFTAMRGRRLRAIAEADLVVFGGGSLLKEIEGGGLDRVRYLLRIVAVVAVARLFGRPTAMVGNGMGPLCSPPCIALSRIAANLTALVTVRDTASRDLLGRIGVRRPVAVVADPVFTLMPPANPPDVMPVDGPFAVVAPRYSLTDAERTAFARACDWLAEDGGVSILFMPLQTGFHPRYDDAEAARDIRSQMRHPDRSTIWFPETPAAALAVMREAELALSARLHGLIFASLAGVAAIAVSYEMKIASFMDESGASDACLSLDQVAAGGLLATLPAVWADRSARGNRAGARAAELRVDAMRAFTMVRELGPAQGFRRVLTLLLAAAAGAAAVGSVLRRRGNGAGGPTLPPA